MSVALEKMTFGQLIAHARALETALEKIAEERQTLYRDQQAKQPVQALSNAALIAVSALGWGFDMERNILIKDGSKQGSGT